MDGKRRNQKEIPTPKTELGKKPREQLFPNRRPLSYPNLNKYMKRYMYIRFKQHKNRLQNHNRSIALERSLLGGGGLQCISANSMVVSDNRNGQKVRLQSSGATTLPSVDGINLLTDRLYWKGALN